MQKCLLILGVGVPCVSAMKRATGDTLRRLRRRLTELQDVRDKTIALWGGDGTKQYPFFLDRSDWAYEYNRGHRVPTDFSNGKVYKVGQVVHVIGVHLRGANVESNPPRHARSRRGIRAKIQGVMMDQTRYLVELQNSIPSASFRESFWARVPFRNIALNCGKKSLDRLIMKSNAQRIKDNRFRVSCLNALSKLGWTGEILYRRQLEAVTPSERATAAGDVALVRPWNRRRQISRKAQARLARKFKRSPRLYRQSYSADNTAEWLDAKPPHSAQPQVQSVRATGDISSTCSEASPPRAAPTVKANGVPAPNGDIPVFQRNPDGTYSASFGSPDVVQRPQLSRHTRNSSSFKNRRRPAIAPDSRYSHQRNPRAPDEGSSSSEAMETGESFTPIDRTYPELPDGGNTSIVDL